jgi:hypothetical protein
VFLPLLDSVKTLISETIAEADDQEDSESCENDLHFSNVPGVMPDDEGTEISEEEHSADEDDGEENETPDAPPFGLDAYTMGFNVFVRLTERLPSAVDGFVVKYELFDGHLHVKTCPSQPHERAVYIVNVTMRDWQRDPNNPTTQGDTLDGCGGAGTPPVLFRTSC